MSSSSLPNRFMLSKALLGLILGPTYFLSATAQTTDEPLEEVVVTGSSIKRIATETSLPVQYFGQAEIVRSGATSVTDFIQQIPAMQGFTSVSESVGGTGGGVTTASLHDVGEQYTLVLLNGRRVAPSDSGTTIDLNSIPLAAIERIEVLTDGASAIYGADAIAGVVNFILKQGESPLALNMRFSKPQHGGGQQANFSVSKGFGDLRTDGYSAFLAVSYDKLNSLKASQREFSKTGLISGKSGGLNYDFFNGSSRSVPPNVDVFGTGVGGQDSDGNSIDYISFSPYYKANGTCSSARVKHVLAGEQCFIDYTSTIEIAPEIERKAIYGSGKLGFGDTGWTAFADFAYTNVGTLTKVAPYPAEFGLSTSSALYQTYIAPYLTPTQQSLVSSVNVKYRLYDLGNRTEKFTTKAMHVVSGVEGKVANWDVTAALTLSNQTQADDYLEGWPLADKFNALIDSGSFDPFTAGTLSPDELAALKSTQYVGNYETTKIGMTGFDVNVQRSLFDLPGGAFITSFGADYRQTTYKKTPSGVAANAEILFDSSQPAYNLSRNNLGFYGEILAPVMSTVELTAAARHDDISGVKDKSSGSKFGGTESASTFKLGGKWRPVSSLVVRASYGTGFRTATMREIAQPKVDFSVTGGSYACPFSASYDPLGYIAAGYVCVNGLQFEEFQGGNPNLKPEKSKQWNVGLIWQPLDAFSVGLNYWSVEITDAVDSASESLILNNPAKYLSLYTTKYKASNNLTYVAILDSPINIGKVQNEGLDWDFSYVQGLGSTTVTGKIAGTYLAKSRYTMPGTDDQWTTSLNAYGVDDKVAFRNVVHASVTLAYSGWEHLIQANYRNGYTDVKFTEGDCVFANDAGDCVAGALKVPSYTTVDWRTSFSFSGTTVTLGIENLFDTAPPRSLRSAGPHQLGYDPRYTNPYLRTFVLSATMKY